MPMGEPQPIGGTPWWETRPQVFFADGSDRQQFDDTHLRSLALELAVDVGKKAASIACDDGLLSAEVIVGDAEEYLAFLTNSVVDSAFDEVDDDVDEDD